MIASAAAATTKTVYLIRHAESEENRRIASLGRCLSSLGMFSLPSKDDIYASTQLLNVPAQVDSNVSEIGANQIAQMGEKLNEVNFLVSSNIELVAHSPLLRARETSEGMLGCVTPDKKAESVSRVVELDLLIEKTPKEWTPMYFNAFKERIGSFEQWVTDQPENKIAIVGHSQFFKAMLGLDFKFGNCDVWEITFDPSKRASTSTENAEAVVETPGANGLTDKPTWNLPPQWMDLKRLYGCDAESSPKSA